MEGWGESCSDACSDPGRFCTCHIVEPSRGFVLSPQKWGFDLKDILPPWFQPSKQQWIWTSARRERHIIIVCNNFILFISLKVGLAGEAYDLPSYTAQIAAKRLPLQSQACVTRASLPSLWAPPCPLGLLLSEGPSAVSLMLDNNQEFSKYCPSKLKGHSSLCHRGQDTDVYACGVGRIKWVIKHETYRANEEIGEDTFWSQRHLH